MIRYFTLWADDAVIAKCEANNRLDAITLLRTNSVPVNSANLFENSRGFYMSRSCAEFKPPQQRKDD